MAARALLQRGGVGLWLLAMLAAGSASGQRLFIVGPGAVVMRQYRPGVAIYGVNAYSYVQTYPWVYGPVAGTQTQIPPGSRIQSPVPMDMGIVTVPPSPYREYYTPHIPRYYRRQESAEQAETPNGMGEPLPSKPENAGAAPATEDERLSRPAEEQTQRQETHTQERTRRPAPRRPTRYR
jgi:hypothetical protein